MTASDANRHDLPDSFSITPLTIEINERLFIAEARPNLYRGCLFHAPIAGNFDSRTGQASCRRAERSAMPPDDRAVGMVLPEYNRSLTLAGVAVQHAPGRRFAVPGGSGGRAPRDAPKSLPGREEGEDFSSGAGWRRPTPRPNRSGAGAAIGNPSRIPAASRGLRSRRPPCRASASPREVRRTATSRA